MWLCACCQPSHRKPPFALRLTVPSPPRSCSHASQVLEGGPEEDLEHLALLLQFLEDETAAHRNFEFVQVRAAIVLVALPA